MSDMSVWDEVQDVDKDEEEEARCCTHRHSQDLGYSYANLPARTRRRALEQTMTLEPESLACSRPGGCRSTQRHTCKEGPPAGPRTGAKAEESTLTWVETESKKKKRNHVRMTLTGEVLISFLYLM